MVPHAVELNPLVVINMQVLLLRDGKHLIILQEANIPHFLLSLEFSDEFFSFPLNHSKMTFTASQ